MGFCPSVPWDSLSMGFSRQEYWNGLPFPPPEDLPDPGIEPVSPVSPVMRAALSHLGSPCLRPSPRPILGAPLPLTGCRPQSRQRWGLGEGAHIWVLGPEPTFLPCEWEVMGSQESQPLLPTVTGPTLAGRLGWGEGRLEGPESHSGVPLPDC